MEDQLKKCTICKKTDTNEFDFGPWMTKDDCTIHYFCALLSKNSRQNGTDEEGILGFLIKDIKYLARSHTKTRCFYCKKPNATVQCNHQNTKCKRYFHIICGIQYKCLFEFEDAFNSYCHEHVEITEEYPIHENWWHCQICTEEMGNYHPITSIPSCCNQGYYHKLCMQKHALSAGSVTKCPSCGKDAEKYQKFLRMRGIYCPEKDANWELVSGAYESLLFQYNRCDAPKCDCLEGRNHFEKSGDWEIIRCQNCGSSAAHAKCSGISFSCPQCTANSQADLANVSRPTLKRQRSVNDATAHRSKREDKIAIGNYKQEDKEMRSRRLNDFIENSNFDIFKPTPPHWLI